MDYDQGFVTALQDIALAGLGSEDEEAKDRCLELIESCCRHGHLVWTEEERLLYSSEVATTAGSFYRSKDDPRVEIVVERAEDVDPGTRRIYYHQVDTGERGSELFRNFHRLFSPKSL